MSTWLKLLPLELDAVEELIEPTEEVKGGENILGTIESKTLKKLWTLYKSMRKTAELMAVEQRYTSPTAEGKGKVVEMATKARTLEQIFWVGVQDELKMWSRLQDKSHYLCVGWQVVEVSQPEMPFKFLFGNQQ